MCSVIWNRFPLKNLIDWFTCVNFCGDQLLEYRYLRLWIIEKTKIRAKSADSLKASTKTGDFKCYLFITQIYVYIYIYLWLAYLPLFITTAKQSIVLTTQDIFSSGHITTGQLGTIEKHWTHEWMKLFRARHAGAHEHKRIGNESDKNHKLHRYRFMAQQPQKTQSVQKSKHKIVKCT